jgi:hypothetical protein
MSLSRRISSALVVLTSLTAAGAVASPLAAQSRDLFEWSGRIDRETYITMRGATARAMQGRYQVGGNLRLQSALPRDDGRVMVWVERGSADVDVVQQPSRRNDYTAIIRVRDDARRNDRVRLSARWRPEYDRRDGRRDDDGGGWGSIEDRRDDRRDLGTRTAFRWSGTVDGEVEIRLQGRHASYRTLSGASVRDVRLHTEQMLPREAGIVSVVRRHGRGSADVVEQPSARNGWTTVIRVRDPQGGASHYAFDVEWRDGDRRGW